MQLPIKLFEYRILQNFGLSGFWKSYEMIFIDYRFDMLFVCMCAYDFCSVFLMTISTPRTEYFRIWKSKSLLTVLFHYFCWGIKMNSSGSIFSWAIFINLFFQVISFINHLNVFVGTVWGKLIASWNYVKIEGRLLYTLRYFPGFESCEIYFSNHLLCHSVKSKIVQCFSFSSYNSWQCLNYFVFILFLLERDPLFIWFSRGLLLI